MADPNELRVLVMARIQQEETIVIGHNRLAAIIRSMIDTHLDVIVVREAQNTPSEDIDGLRRLTGKPTQSIEELKTASNGRNGARLLIYYHHRRATLPPSKVVEALGIWKEYLEEDGRIVMQLRREDYDLGDGDFVEEDWERTIKRYRRAARDAGMKMVQVNGFPFSGPEGLKSLSTEVVVQSLDLIRQAGRMLEASDGFGAAQMARTADAWEDRLVTRREVDLAFSMRQHLDAQAAIFGTFKKQPKSRRAEHAGSA